MVLKDRNFKNKNNHKIIGLEGILEFTWPELQHSKQFVKEFRVDLGKSWKNC